MRSCSGPAGTSVNVDLDLHQMVRGFREREAVRDWRLRERALAGGKEPAETQEPCAGEPWTMLTLASDYRLTAQ